MKKARFGPAIVAGIIAVLAVALFTWIHLAEQRGYARIRERIEELRKPGGGCGARTRIPRGTPIPGNAWDCYRAALTAAVPSAVDSDHFDALPDENGSKGSELEFARGFVARYGKALDLLARGARSADLGDPVAADRKRRCMAPDLVRLAELRVEVLLQEGRVREAVEPLLDLHRFYMDCEESGIPSSYFRRERDSVFTLFTHTLESASMTPSAWADLEGQLVVLDQGAPCCLLEARRKHLDFGLDLLPETRKFAWIPSFHQLRYLYSETLLCQAAFFRVDEGIRSLEPLHEGDYTELSGRCHALRREYEASSNPLLSLIGAFGAFGNDEIEVSRKHRAEIRLLRMAAAYRARGEFMELTDPLGTVLLHAIEGDQVKLWSKGGIKLDLKR